MKDRVLKKLLAAQKKRSEYANKMRERMLHEGVETVGLDERDWVILRLLFLLYKEGRNASEPEAVRVINWFNSEHPGYGQEVMLAAFSRLAGENRIRREKLFEPYWKEKGKWE
jgi:hypothetical protein